MKNILRFILPVVILLSASACSSNRNSQMNRDSLMSDSGMYESNGMRDSLNSDTSADSSMNGTVRDSAGSRP